METVRKMLKSFSLALTYLVLFALSASPTPSAAETQPKATAPYAAPVGKPAVNPAVNPTVPLSAQVSSPDAGLTFAQAWDQILKRNLRVQTQALSVDLIAQKRLLAIGAFIPTLAIQSSDNRGTAYYPPQRSLGLVAGVNLFRSGADLDGLSAVEMDRRSAQQKLFSETQVAEEEAAQALTQVIARVQQRRLVEKIAKLKLDSLRVAQERFKQGLLPQQEVDKVLVDVENSQARLTDQVSSEVTARGTLETLLASSDIRIEWPWRQILVEGPKLEQIAFDLSQRPDWRSSQAAVQAEHLRRRRTVKLMLPSLDLNATYGTADVTDLGRRDWSSSLVLTIPLFEGFKNYAAFGTQDLNYQGALIQSEAIRRSAPIELENFRHSYQAARDSALLREKTAKLTERLFEDNFLRFKMGRATANDLAFDQNRLFESELLAVDGWTNAHLSFVRLCHALGRYVRPTGECQVEEPVFSGAARASQVQ
jgi:outer membrane protein TolC